MNKDDLLKLVKSILEKFQNKELQEQRAFIEEANKAEDINDFLFKDHPDALKWYKFVHMEDSFEWFYTKEAEELYNSADTFAKRCLFVIRWFDSFSDFRFNQIDTDVATLYATIVWRLNLKYSDFVTQNSIFGSFFHKYINAFKENANGQNFNIYLKKRKEHRSGLPIEIVSKYGENDFETLAKQLIKALHIFDGTPIDESNIILSPSPTMPCPNVYHFNNKDCEYLSTLIIGFYYKYKGFINYNQCAEFESIMWKGKFEPDYTIDDVAKEESDLNVLRCYLSADVFKQYTNNINDAQKYIFERERRRVLYYFCAHHKLDFNGKPKLSFLKQLYEHKTNYLHEARKVLDNEINETKVDAKTNKTGMISISCTILGLLFAIIGSIPLQLLSGLLIVLGIMGTFSFYSKLTIAKKHTETLYNKLSTTKNEVESFVNFIKQDISIIDDESEFISLLEDYSIKYKKAFEIYTQRQKLADKLYLENPQQLHAFDFNISESESNEFMADMKAENEAFASLVLEKFDEKMEEFNEIKERVRQQEEIRRAERNAEREIREARRKADWEKTKARDEAKRAEEDAKRAGLLQCRHCSRRDKCSFWVKSNNKGNCASYRP